MEFGIPSLVRHALSPIKDPLLTTETRRARRIVGIG